MAGKRRPSAYTQIISEQQKEQPENQKLGEALKDDNITTSQSDNAIKSINDKNTLSQNDNTVMPESDIAVESESNKSVLSQNDNRVVPQNNNIVTSQQDKVPLSQNNNTILSQSNLLASQEKKRRSTERERITYYLDPSQVDKLEDIGKFTEGLTNFARKDGNLH
jgi:hypothetical protein